ncbi:DUF11 domain-containing protein [Meiothermus sp. CFH 77666]|uniref:DUF11 domain-containing protein n=1 Tax=Meiothermus sp. CFH 77666 TaxID=2817942 RepID=UPI00325FBF10
MRSFATVFNSNTTGDIRILGNTLMTCGSSTVTPTNPPSCNTNNTSQNNNLQTAFVDFDTDSSTSNSSRAALSLPSGAQVLFAGLYWGARANPSTTTRNQIRWRPPGSSGYQTLTADWIETITTQGAAASRPYAAFANVTSLVQSAGAGDYWVGDITALTGNDGLGFYAGWSLVVVYQHSSEPLRRLTVSHGLAVVSSGNNVTQTVSGLLTPAVGTVQARVGAVAWEGDGGINGDQFQIRPTGSPTWTSLSDTQNPSNNFFNSSISALDTRYSAKSPDYINQLALDADIVQYNSLPNNTTSVDLQFTSTGDTYFPQVLTFAVNIYAPDLTSTFTKSVADLNGGNVLIGDILEYTVSFTNTGQDGATNVVVRDPIPTGTQYVPGSLQVISNAPSAPTGTFSDAAGDDIAEYSPSCSELSGSPPCVRFRLGTGANASQGGLILPTQGASVRFRVQVLPSAAGQTITNTAQVSYNAQTLGTAFNQTASANVSTTVPTPPSISKAFGPASIPIGNPSTLTITLSNPNAQTATLTAALVDNLPSGLTVASPPAATTTCTGGTLTANPGSTSVTLSSGAQIPANSTCTISVNVTGSTPGSYTNTLNAGALQTNLGNSTAPATATLTILGASLSGRIYADSQPNGLREPDETWTGPTVYVNLVQGSSVVQSVAVSAGSGAYTFSAVAPGSYTLVVSTTPSSTTPTAPTGWLFINPAGSRPINMGSSSISDQDFGLFNGSRIRGTVFYDDGLSSGTANDARQNGGEPGIPNVLVSASDGTNSKSVTTDAGGAYTLFIPASFGSTVTLSHPQQPATGSNVGGASVSLATSYGSAAAASRTISGFSPGQYYEGYNFGVVRDSRLSPDQSGQSPSPGTITYGHLYRPGTLGTVNLIQSGGSYTYALRRDVNCDGDFADPGEGFQPLPQSFTVDATWPRETDGSLRACALELQVVVPAGLPAGRVDMAQLQAVLGWANNPAITDNRRVFDTTTVVSAGGLQLLKEVRNVSTGSPFAANGQGRPGEVLEYRIAYRNIGSQPIFSVVLADPIPFFTDLVQNAYGGSGEVELACPNGSLVYPNLGPATNISLNLASLCPLSTAPHPSGSGTAPALLPGQGGYFLYRVQVK